MLLPQFNRKAASIPLTNDDQGENLESIEGTAEDSSPANTLAVHVKEEGIIPRAIRELFAQIEKKRNDTSGKSRISVKVQYIQLYNEKVYDLLNTNKQKIVASKKKAIS